MTSISSSQFFDKSGNGYSTPKTKYVKSDLSSSNQLLKETRNDNQNSIVIYEAALNVDANVLTLLLQRNARQHSKTRYYRRLDMVMRCMRKHDILSTTTASTVEESKKSNTRGGIFELIRDIAKERDRIASIVELWTNSRRRRTRNNDSMQIDDQWNIVPSLHENNQGTDSSHSNSLLLFLVEKLYLVLTLHLPETLSRILHASAALTIEMSRGYFVPMCSVSLACVARIRYILMKMGRDGILQLRNTLSWLKKIPSSSKPLHDDSKNTFTTNKSISLTDYSYLDIAESGSELESRTGLIVHKVAHLVDLYTSTIFDDKNRAILAFVETNPMEVTNLQKEWIDSMVTTSIRSKKISRGDIMEHQYPNLESQKDDTLPLSKDIDFKNDVEEDDIGISVENVLDSDHGNSFGSKYGYNNEILNKTQPKPQTINHDENKDYNLKIADHQKKRKTSKRSIVSKGDMGMTNEAIISKDSINLITTQDDDIWGTKVSKLNAIQRKDRIKKKKKKVKNKKQKRDAIDDIFGSL